MLAASFWGLQPNFILLKITDALSLVMPFVSNWTSCCTIRGEIVLLISNKPCAAYLSYFEIIIRLITSLRCNHSVFLVQFGINLHLWVLQKAEVALVEAAHAITAFWKTHPYKLIQYKLDSKQYHYSTYPLIRTCI